MSPKLMGGWATRIAFQRDPFGSSLPKFALNQDNYLVYRDAIPWSGPKMHQESFNLSIKKQCFTKETKHWNRFLTNMVNDPNPSMVLSHLDTDFNNMLLLFISLEFVRQLEHCRSLPTEILYSNKLHLCLAFISFTKSFLVFLFIF